MSIGKMVKGKKGLIVVVSLVVMLALGVLAGCGEPTSNEPGEATDGDENTLKFVFTQMDLSNPYFIEVSRGFQERCDELGIKNTLGDGRMDAAGQVNAVENYIQAGYDAIFINPVDPVGAAAVIQEARNAGICVLSQAQPIDGSCVYHLVPEYDYGYSGGVAAGEWVNQHWADEEVVKFALYEYPEIESIIDRGKGLEDGLLATAPNVEIVARHSAIVPEEGLAGAEPILQAHPDLKGFICINDAGALGALEIVRGWSGIPDVFYIGGLDGTAEAVTRMLEGDYFRTTADMEPYNCGRKMVDMMLEHMNDDYTCSGETMEEFFPTNVMTQEDLYAGKWDEFLEGRDINREDYMGNKPVLYE